MSLYNLKSTATPLYSITKFTDDLDVEATYSVARTVCDCPAGARASCRHRQMLPTLLERVDTAWFWDFDAKLWLDPTGEANKPATVDEAEPPTDEGSLSNEVAFAPKAEGYSLPNEPAEYNVLKAVAGDDPWGSAPKPAPAFKRRL